MSVQPLTSGDHSADRAKQNIKQWVIDFCALSLVTDDGEMRFDGIYVHDDSSKEVYWFIERLQIYRRKPMRDTVRASA